VCAYFFKLESPIVKYAATDHHRLFRGPFDCLTWLYRHYGISGWFKGGNAMLLRDVPGFAAYLPLYEALMARFHRKYDWNYSAASIVSGGITGVVTWQMVVPFDVVKSRLQADDFQHPKYCRY
jgi:hypothetical protein